MKNGVRVIRRPRRAGPPTARTRRHHRHRRPGPAGGVQRQRPVVGRFRWLIECGRVSELPGGGRLFRLHALPRPAGLPRPTSGGGIPKESAQHLGVSSSQFYAAQRACQHLLPATGGSLTASSLQQCYLAGVCPQALVQQAMNAGLKFARCMRSHTVPNWPDPTIDSQGRPGTTSTCRISLRRMSVPRSTNARAWSTQARCWRGGDHEWHCQAAGRGPSVGGGSGGGQAPSARLGGRGPGGGGAGGGAGGRVAGGGVRLGCVAGNRAAGGAGDGGGSAEGCRGGDAGGRDAGVCGLLDGDRARRRDADLAPPCGQVIRQGQAVYRVGQQQPGGAAVRQRAGLAGDVGRNHRRGCVPAQP